jgi:hypothetical protein
MGIATGQYRLGKLNGQHVVTWWEDGKRKRYRLGSGLSQGAANAELIRWVKDREILLERESKTVSDIMRLYIKDREIDGKSIEKQRFSWKALEPFFGALSPDDVEKETCDAYRARRRELGRQEGTIWTELSVLRAALNWALDRKKIKSVPKVWLPPQPRAKERHLTREEADRFISELHAPHLRLFVLLALGTAGLAHCLNFGGRASTGRGARSTSGAMRPRPTSAAPSCRSMTRCWRPSRRPRRGRRRPMCWSGEGRGLRASRAHSSALRPAAGGMM